MKKIIINNGNKEKVINKDEKIPDGWIRGRLPFAESTTKKISESRKGRIHVHRGNEGRVIYKEKLQEYIDQGFELGRPEFSEKAKQNIIDSRKKFFEEHPHRTNQTSFKSGNVPWNVGVPWSSEMRKNYKLARTGVTFTEEKCKIKKEKEIQTRIKNYGSLENSYAHASKVAQKTIEKLNAENPNRMKEIIDKRKKTSILHFGCECPLQSKDIQKKIYNSKKKNNSFNTSTPEEDFYKKLAEYYDEKDIHRQYKDDRYPFLCDFYIKSQDLFIELNLFWTHGNHRFDPYNENDIQLLKEIQKNKKNTKNSKGKNVPNMFYVFEYIWTIRDPLKCKTAKDNNLNYITLYNKEQIYDFFTRIQAKNQK